MRSYETKKFQNSQGSNQRSEESSPHTIGTLFICDGWYWSTWCHLESTKRHICGQIPAGIFRDLSWGNYRSEWSMSSSGSQMQGRKPCCLRGRLHFSVVSASARPSVAVTAIAVLGWHQTSNQLLRTPEDSHHQIRTGERSSFVSPSATRFSASCVCREPLLGYLAPIT